MPRNQERNAPAQNRNWRLPPRCVPCSFPPQCAAVTHDMDLTRFVPYRIRRTLTREEATRRKAWSVSVGQTTGIC